MAIDTENKLRSATTYPWAPVYPNLAAVTLNAGDLAQAAGMYRDITFDTAAALVASPFWTVVGPPRVLTVEGEKRTLTVVGWPRTLRVDND